MAVVFVDELRPTPISKEWPYKEVCHMWSESEEELNRMARRLGLRPFWNHNSYYDLTKNVRKRAVKLGCVEIGAKELIEKMKGVVAE